MKTPIRICGNVSMCLITLHRKPPGSAPDVAEGEGERLFPAGVAFDLGHMVGHDHAVVADFFVDAHGADHVHVAVVGESLLEIAEAAVNVAEMDVEDLAASCQNSG